MTPTSSSPAPPHSPTPRAVCATGDSASWLAPQSSGPVVGTVSVPSSKSEMNRALILAALASGPSRIGRPLRSRDTDLMAQALRELGADVSTSDPNTWRVTPTPPRGGVTIDCGLAGTVMRFIPAVAALATGDVVLDGDEAARRRPMAPITAALRTLGAQIDGDALPLTVHGAGRLPGGTVQVDASASSQFVSGLLLAAPAFEQGVTVRHIGESVPSLPHVQMTVECLRRVGVTVHDDEPNTWRVLPGPIDPWQWPIEPDLSNATPFLAAAAVTGGTVTVPGWPNKTTQAGAAFPAIAEQMGCTWQITDDGLKLTGPAELRGIDVDLHDVGELTPTICAMALVANGPSHLRGIGHLRGHETDRLAALAADAAAIGGDIVADETSLRINPRPLRSGRWAAYADHRMATAGAIIGLVVQGVTVDDIATTAKTMPDFPADWAALVAGDLREGEAG